MQSAPRAVEVTEQGARNLPMAASEHRWGMYITPDGLWAGELGTCCGRGVLTPCEVVLGLSTAATAEQWRLCRCRKLCKP